MNVNDQKLTPHTVAIIGLGPKGFYCLERLLAEFKVRPLCHPLHIHVFNRSAHFGASPIYDPTQPEYILVNISVGEIDLWATDNPPVIVTRKMNFLEWYQTRFAPITPLSGEEFLPRAIVGQYLTEGFQQLIKNLPNDVMLFSHIGEVVDIQSNNDEYLLRFISDTGQAEEIAANKILLATGHSKLQLGNKERHYQLFASQHAQALFIPFVYPVVETMSQIPSGVTVAIRGIGLTFIDAVLELTEGRGGRFRRNAQGDLIYLAGGEEPQKIIPFSRSGLPMTPKAGDLPNDLRPLTFFTNEALANAQHNAPDGKLDLERDVWPLFELEMEYCYYQAAMKADGEQQWLEMIGNDADTMHKVIKEYLNAHPERQSFDYKSVLDPISNLTFESGRHFASFIEQYLELEIERARRGHAGCPLKAAIDIWYEVRKELGSFLKFGGLTPESHQQLIEFYYPRLKRVVFGPPIINVEKILALQKAWVLDFSVARNPEITMNNDTGFFMLRNEETGTEASARVLVDAHYPETRISKDSSSLYRNLYQRGVIREFENRQGSFTYSPGAIDMAEETQFIIDSNGITNNDIAVIGIPTEGNLVGNLTMGRDKYASIWAAEIIKQLQNHEFVLDNSN